MTNTNTHRFAGTIPVQLALTLSDLIRHHEHRLTFGQQTAIIEAIEPSRYALKEIRNAIKLLKRSRGAPVIPTPAVVRCEVCGNLNEKTAPECIHCALGGDEQ